jgi:hypothetical protein
VQAIDELRADTDERLVDLKGFVEGKVQTSIDDMSTKMDTMYAPCLLPPCASRARRSVHG